MAVPDACPNAAQSTANASAMHIPHANGKTQPWLNAYPPAKQDLVGVAESRGQMLLLDGTGGSGTTAMPNQVALPPKTKEQQEKEQKFKDNETQDKPQTKQ
ncbi:unnamed protein product [Zymoseptoria tritici ST99CH_1A5]|uniref:Uncharacterized protein n=4 Tax=Zymoseptoria tritici TaxID=1047171 RepID=F9XAT9_ZYMTI|nr:uncharacterized protein MYCGRDRAFT_104380 [Zymoseptoria tritici IPO323]EGP87057.1 hypothetical protein MYCGRDRAFT_104380 [Zymoseptoria tritici IPO323]SMQ50577.1 unnamed protein product [Zymoseptoria tritici ST99CH_3D7]SMR52363.1 unnamed protein product [Zymoseptoria tritici ST99CH_1E4]SMY24245.1 unnamed protein product [Zymoseptoria tritici ST99CH_1A5]